MYSELEFGQIDMGCVTKVALIVLAIEFVVLFTAFYLWG